MSDDARRRTVPIVTLPRELGHCAELEPFALRVIGNSMEPEFADGQVVVVDPGLVPTNGSYAVVEADGETLLRQYWRLNGRVRLCPLNPALPESFPDSCRVLGVVTQRAGARRAERKRYD